MAFHSKMGAPNLLTTKQISAHMRSTLFPSSRTPSTLSSSSTLERSSCSTTTIKSPFLCSQLVYIFSILILLLSTCPDCQAESILTISEPVFTPWNQNVTYVSSTKYNARGMGPLYKTTNDILDLFIGEKAIPDDYIIVTEGNVELGPKARENDWSDLLKHYWGILLVVAATALLVALMPIIGLCFCCCRCAGACGGRSQPFDKKHDTCRRVFLGLLLIGAATAILFGVVVAFVTNSYMQEGVEDTTTTARHAVEDTKLFLESISVQINYLLDPNYKELAHCLLILLNETKEKVVEELKKNSQAISIEYLTKFVKKLPTIHENLLKMRDITNDLRVKASQLSDGLRGVKRELLVTLNNCSEDECTDVLEKYEIGKLDANGIDYNQLPDVTSIINGVQNLTDSNIVDKISKGEHALQNMETDLRNIIEKNMPQVKKSINDAGAAIKKASNDIVKNFQKISNTVGNHSIKNIDIADEYIARYSMYRFYAGIAISCILLLVLVCITLALFCGICGKRPDGYGDDCCNKGSGSRFLMLGVTIIFLTISILAAVALVLFLSGLVLHRGVCIPLNNPDDQVFNYVDDFVDLNQVLYADKANSMTRFRISELVISCRRNNSIYEVLRLYNAFNVQELREYPSKYHIPERLDELIQSIEINKIPNILPEDAEKAIRQLADSELNEFSSDRFIDNLNETITKYSLADIAAELENTALKITKQKMGDVRVTLKNQALHLKSYQTNLVQPMINSTKNLLNLVKELESDLKTDGKSFKDSIDKLLEEVRYAQDFIEKNGTKFVQTIALELATRFKNFIDAYMTLVIDAIENEVGRCEPLMNVFNATVIATCNKVVDPFNGFWAGVAWCVIIFLPTLIISVILSNLYQKSDPYPGPLVESEYLYDAYSERDNIPLANGPKNKKRKPKGRRHGSRDRRGDYYEDSGSSHGASTGRDTRYSDMAPKHWDGGPPRYQNPPMAPPASEYERPPPYYYPGAPAEQD